MLIVKITFLCTACECQTMSELRTTNIFIQLNRFTNHTVEAVKAREKVRELRRTRDKQQEKGRQHQEQFKAAQDELSHINEKINIMIDNTLDELSLKRRIYHKGALVGNDVAKILQPVHIKQIVHIFKPILIKQTWGKACL